MALNLKHQTATEFAARLREKYKNSSREECARLAKWVLDHIEAGDFTETQVRNAFGLDATQWIMLKGRMQNHRDAYEAVMSAGGE